MPQSCPPRPFHVFVLRFKRSPSTRRKSLSCEQPSSRPKKVESTLTEMTSRSPSLSKEISLKRCSSQNTSRSPMKIPTGSKKIFSSVKKPPSSRKKSPICKKEVPTPYSPASPTSLKKPPSSRKKSPISKKEVPHPHSPASPTSPGPPSPRPVGLSSWSLARSPSLGDTNMSPIIRKDQPSTIPNKSPDTVSSGKRDRASSMSKSLKKRTKSKSLTNCNVDMEIIQSSSMSQSNWPVSTTAPCTLVEHRSRASMRLNSRSPIIYLWNPSPPSPERH